MAKHKKHRQKAVRIYDGLYTLMRHDPENPFSCFYCGEPASGVDHQPPISRVSDYQSIQLKREIYLKVPCCEECNNLVGEELTIDLLERERFVKHKLDKKYRKLADSPYWTEKELAQLKGRLKEHIENHVNRLEWLERRINYSGGVQWYADSLDNPESKLYLAS